MKIASFAVTALAAILVAGVLTAAVQDKKGADKPEKKETPKHASALVDSATAQYTEAIPGVMRAVISGDPTTGAYRAFTKFAPGTVHPMHSHPNELWILVIKGAYIQKSESGEETRVGPGCSFHIPAGDKHVSSGDPKEGVVMLEESSAKFGMDLADKGKEKEKEKK